MYIVWNLSQVYIYAEQPGKRHLGGGYSESTFREIVAGAYQSLAYGRAQRFHQGQGIGNVYPWDGCTREESRVCQVLEVVRTGQFVVCCAELVKQAARALERHIDGLRGIVDDPGSGDEQRRDDGQALISSPVLVVQAVLARAEGGPRGCPSKSYPGLRRVRHRHPRRSGCAGPRRWRSLPWHRDQSCRT